MIKENTKTEKNYPNFVEFTEKYKAEQRKINLKEVKNISSKTKPNKWLLDKINNYLERNKFSNLGTPKDILESIKNNDLIATMFAKDPSRQNISEILSTLYIPREYDVENFKNLSNKSSVYIINGVVENNNIDDFTSKTVDFYWEYNGKRFYASQKYTMADGGAQDNQYNDLINFGKNAMYNENADEIYVIIADGDYYKRNNRFGVMFDKFDNNENVFVVTTDTLVRCLK